jgi:hypothetical protein
VARLGDGRERERHALEVVREVARRGQERRPAVLVAAVARDGLAPLQHCLDRLQLGRAQRPHLKGPAVLREPWGVAEARAHEHRAHALLIEHPARRNGGDGGAARVGDGAQRAEQRLQQRPAAKERHEARVLGRTRGIEAGSFRAAEQRSWGRTGTAPTARGPWFDGWW